MGAQSDDKSAPNYDPEADEDEGPDHEVILDSFRIARFPVTVTEYAELIDDDGYADPRWWRAGGHGETKQPGNWEGQQDHPSRPVVNVSWYEAMAYCAWLTERLARPQGPSGNILLEEDQVVRLPTEVEWEFAARGAEGRRYPWGDTKPDQQTANFDYKVGHTTPVGLYPAGATPEGILDLAGKVYKWCLDVWGRSRRARRCSRPAKAAIRSCSMPWIRGSASA